MGLFEIFGQGAAPGGMPMGQMGPSPGQRMLGLQKLRNAMGGKPPYSPPWSDRQRTPDEAGLQMMGQMGLSQDISNQVPRGFGQAGSFGGPQGDGLFQNLFLPRATGTE